MKTVMIAGPQYDLSDREIKLLHDFWEKQGRILLLIDPSAKTPKLNAFLNELGVKANDDRLMVFLRTGIQEVALTRDVQAHFLGGSPITKRLAEVRALFFGGTSSLTLEPERVRAANIRLEPLIGIAPKVPKTLTFSLNEDALRNLRWIILVLLPLVPAVIGGAVWWRRRA